jgi:hypothetical protein
MAKKPCRIDLKRLESALKSRGLGIIRPDIEHSSVPINGSCVSGSDMFSSRYHEHAGGECRSFSSRFYQLIRIILTIMRIPKR